MRETTLVEIVARAIVTEDQINAAGWKSALPKALDAIAAIRDPPPAVVEAGAKAVSKAHFDRKQWYGVGPKSEWVADMVETYWRNSEPDFVASWRAALDAN